MYQNCCQKCGSVDLYTEKKGNNIGLYCSDCGSWIKWLSKNELRAFEHKALELSMYKKYVKIVENAIKAHNKMLRDQEKAERLELERIAAKNRRLQKKKEKREQVKELKREETIEMQKEAYLRAIKEYKSDKKKEK